MTNQMQTWLTFTRQSKANPADEVIDFIDTVENDPGFFTDNVAYLDSIANDPDDGAVRFKVGISYPDGSEFDLPCQKDGPNYTGGICMAVNDLMVAILETKFPPPNGFKPTFRFDWSKASGEVGSGGGRYPGGLEGNDGDGAPTNP